MTEENTIKKGSSVDELSERISGLGVVNRDMATFIAHNWQKVLWGIGIIILITIIYYQYLGTQQKRSFDAAQRFESAQLQFKEILNNISTKNVDNVDNSIKAFTENVNLIKTTHSDIEYAKIAKLYQAIAFSNLQEYGKANEIFSSLSVNRYLNTNLPKTLKQVADNDLIEELSTLAYLRNLIAENKTDISLLNSYLKSLIFSSKYVTVEAIVLYYRTASTNESKAEVDSVIKQLMNVRTESKGIIIKALSNEDITISE